MDYRTVETQKTQVDLSEQVEEVGKKLGDFETKRMNEEEKWTEVLEEQKTKQNLQEETTNNLSNTFQMLQEDLGCRTKVDDGNSRSS